MWARIVFSSLVAIGCGKTDEQRAYEANRAKHGAELWDLEQSERAYAIRSATYDAISPELKPGESREQWISRPGVCEPSRLVTRFTMSAGTFHWRDHFADRTETAAISHLRGLWRRALVTTLTACRRDREGVLVRRYIDDLAAALSHPDAIHAFDALLDGEDDDKNFALDVLREAPTRAMHERVARLARSNDQVARLALIEVENLPVPAQISAAWQSWMSETLDDPRPGALEALVAIAAGRTVEATPEGKLTIDIRHAAARTARYRSSTSKPVDVPAELLLAVATDPDPDIRREGVQLLDASRPEARALLQQLATHEPDARVRMLAQSRLSFENRDKLESTVP